MTSFKFTPINSDEESSDELLPNWEWYLHPDEESMSQAAARALASEVQVKRNSLICLATGSSPKRTYDLIVEHAREDNELYGQVRWLKLDEWGGLAMDDPASCEHFLRQILLSPLSVPPERYFGWESQPKNPEMECRRVAQWLDANGPIDIQVLGLGQNGHLGFNEPAEQLQSAPHVATLSSVSLSHTMLRQSQGEVEYGLTLGMGDILNARRIFLLVSGEKKAQQLLRLATGKISPQFPASLLRRHRRTQVFCDTAAASLLPPEMFQSSNSLPSRDE